MYISNFCVGCTRGGEENSSIAGSDCLPSSCWNKNIKIILLEICFTWAPMLRHLRWQTYLEIWREKKTKKEKISVMRIILVAVLVEPHLTWITITKKWNIIFLWQKFEPLFASITLSSETSVAKIPFQKQITETNSQWIDFTIFQSTKTKLSQLNQHRRYFSHWHSRCSAVFFALLPSASRLVIGAPVR